MFSTLDKAVSGTEIREDDQVPTQKLQEGEAAELLTSGQELVREER